MNQATHSLLFERVKLLAGWIPKGLKDQLARQTASLLSYFNAQTEAFIPLSNNDTVPPWQYINNIESEGPQLPLVIRFFLIRGPETVTRSIYPHTSRWAIVKLDTISSDPGIPACARGERQENIPTHRGEDVDLCTQHQDVPQLYCTFE